MTKALIFFVALGYSISVNAQTALDWVDPFIGTANADRPTKWGAEGGTYPGSVAPWGLIQLSPETKTGHLRGYDRRDSTIYFFSCANHSSGYPNGSAGTMKVLPLAEPRFRKKHTAGRPFRHQQEKASPAYYKVQFSDDNGIAEMTTAVRTGMFRFSFPTGVLPRIFLGEMGKLVPKSKRMLYGERYNVVLSFPYDMMGMETVDGGVIITFAPKPGDNSILIKMAFSTVDANGSMRNMQAECPDWSFDNFKNKNQQAWHQLLNKVAIEDPSAENKTKFYTSLYHSFLIPWIVSDVDGQYKGARGKVYKTKGKNQYSKFSPWDTYRSLHPLLSLVVPDVQEDMIRSLLDTYEQTGKLPKGPMTGYHTLPVILDTWRKGIKGFDSSLAWTAMKAALDTTAKEPDFDEYQQIGYVSAAYSESVTKTVEFAYNDWVMAEMAKDMNDTAAYARYASRGYNYRHLFHLPSGFIVPRKGETFFPEPESRGYKEGDKWIYTYAIPHDARGLINLMGGDSVFVAQLDSAMSTELLMFDNEPAFHVPYLFNFANRPDVSQAWLREIMQSYFSTGAGGIPGNDDLGSMSSWFVFSAMGFYPVAVGLPVYEVGSPLFKKLVLQLPNGKQLTISAPANTSKNVYVKSMEWNGVKKNTLTISHEEISAGGNWQFNMSDHSSEGVFEINQFEGRSATTRAMDARVEGYHIDNTAVMPNDTVWVRYTVKNEGAEGRFPVTVYHNGKAIASNFTWVWADSIASDSVAVQLYEPGDHKINLNNGSDLVLKLSLPANSSNITTKVEQLQARPLVKLGEQQELVYWVKNITGKADTATVTLSNNGEPVQAQKVFLQPGERKKITTRYIPKRPGVQLLQAGDQTIRSKAFETATDKQVLDIAIGKNRSGNKIQDLSGLENHGQWIEETRRMGDNTIATIQYVQFESSSSLDELEEEITVMAWVFPGKQKGMADIVSKGDFIVFQQSGNMLSFFAGGWGQGSCDVPLPKNWENKWHHIAGTCKGRVFTVYIDGVKAGSFTVDRAVNLSSRLHWVMGGNEEFPDQRYFNGRINGFKVYAAALSAEEIEQEMLPME